MCLASSPLREDVLGENTSIITPAFLMHFGIPLNILCGKVGHRRGRSTLLLMRCWIASLRYRMASVHGLLSGISEAEGGIGPKRQPTQLAAASVHDKPRLASMRRHTQPEGRWLAIEVI